MSDWPHQVYAAEELPRRMLPGRRVCLTSPTGGGKTRILTTELVRTDEPAIVYTNRRMLLQQTSRVLEAAGIKHGIIAAGHAADASAPIQLASIQTVDARVFKRKTLEMHKAKRVYIDEAHVNKEATVCEIVHRHLDDGAALCGITATPLNIGHMYDELIVCGTVSELRKCGALVPAHYFAPDEPDTKNLKRTKTGEYTQGDVVKAIMSPTIVGRVIDNWKRLNPEGWPTLCFGPGVEESLWLAQQFQKAGISAAHIDGEKIWINGTTHNSDDEMREALGRMSRDGEVEIVCNRFVLREGIDWPWIRHMIFATIFGALTSYIQSGGRGMRAYAGKDKVTIQDHGGNWYRHGSLNSDREWMLDKTDYIVGELREQRMREKKEQEPICCPKCHAVRAGGVVCKSCGHSHQGKVRIVVQKDGTLREVKGDIFKPRPLCKRPDGEKIWERMYWRSKTERGDRTFHAAAALFAMENNWQWPDPKWSFMPKDDIDRYMLVSEVPMERLIRGVVQPKPKPEGLFI